MGRYRSRWSLLLLSLLPMTASSALAETFHDAELDYRFELPAGYRPHTPGFGRPRERSAFLRGELRVGSYAALSVQGLGGTIGRGAVDRQAVERAAHTAAERTGVEPTRFEYSNARWQRFELEVVATRISTGNVEVVTLAVQVPLARQALQLVLLGPATELARLRSELTAMLGTLQGHSNWRSDEQRERPSSEGVWTSLAIGLGAMALLALLRWRVWPPRSA